MRRITLNRLLLISLISIADIFSAINAHGQCGGRDSFAAIKPICANQNTTFTNYATGGASTYDFKWGDGTTKTGVNSTASQTHKYTSAGTYTAWMIRHFTSPSCTDSDSIVVVVNPTTKPDAAFSYSPSTVSCVGTTINFKDLSTGHSLTWLWDFGDGTTSTLQNPGHQFYSSGSGTTTFNVKLTVTDYGGCSSDDTTETITIKQAIEPSIGDSINIFSQFRTCSSTLTNDSFLIGLQNNDAGDKAISSYSINWGDGSAVYNAGSSFSSKAHLYTSLGEFTIKFTAKDTNGCSWTIDTTVINESNPSIGVSDNGSTAGCVPQTFWFKLTAKNVSSTTKFIWNFGDGTAPVTWDYTKANDSIQHTYTKTSCGNNPPGGSCSNCFIVAAQAINSCDSTTATVDDIKIYAKPTPNFTYTSGSLCANTTTVSFTNTSVTNCISSNAYKWNFGDGSATTTATNPTHKYTKQGIYNVMLIATNLCGMDTIIKPIEIDSVPVNNFTFSATPGCVPVAVNFTNTSSGLNLKYSWSVSPATGWSFTGSTGSTSKSPQITFTVANTYTVTLTVSNGCGTVSKSQTIVIPTKPVVVLNSISNHCGPYTFTPSASFTNEGSTITAYNWTFTGGSPPGSSSQNPGSITYSGSGTYKVKISATNSCGTSADSQSFTINPLPNARNSGNQSICSGASVNIGSTSVGGDTYSWSSVPSGFSSTSSNPKVSPTSTISYILTETITATGCSKTDTVTITVNPLPAANAGSNKSICIGNSTTIGAVSISGDSYLWSPSTGLSSNTISNPTADPNSSTTYTLVETITSTGCKDSNTVKVTVNPLPAANAGSNATICMGQAVNIGANAVAGSTYAWKPATGLSSTTSSNPKASPSSTTIYTLVETNSNGCVDSNTVKVTVNPVPNAATASPQTICAFQSVSIGASSVSGDTYSWSPSAGLNSTTVSNPTATPGSTTSYTLTETITATGCTHSNSIKITVNPLPAAKTGPDVTICTNTSTVIGSTSVAGDTYAWSPSAGLSSTTVSNPTAGPASTTSYTLLETITATGCKDSNTVKVTVNPLPTPSVTGNITVCAGDTDVYSTTNTSGNSYSWVVLNGSIVSGSGTNSVKVVWNSKSSGRISVIEKAGATSCQDSSFKTITINPQPAANAGSNVSICLGKSSSIGASSVSGDTYSWSPSGGLSSSTVSNPTANPTSTTSYTLTETIAATGCKNFNAVKVTVNPLPAANAGSNTTICMGQSVNLGAGSVAGSTYLWKPSAGLSSTSTSNPKANPTTTTTYTLVETNINGCVDSNTVKITVNPVPNAAVSSPQTICATQSVSIGAASVSGDSYSWSPVTGLNSSTVSNPTATPTSTTTYTVTETIIATGCSNSNSIKITVNPLPAAKAGSDVTICVNTTTVIGSNSVSGDTYFWSPSTGLSSSTVSNPTAGPTSTTTYKLIETVTATGCKDSNLIKVTVNPLPTPSASGSLTVCAGDTDTYSTKNVSGNNYSWVVQGGNIVSGSGTNSVKIVWGSGSSGRVRVLEKAGSTSCQDSSYILISINPQPAANAGSNVSICSGKSATIGASSVSGDTYSWSPGTGLNSTTISSPVANPSSTTSYTLTETITATGCKNIHNVKVIVNPLPAANAGSNVTICSGQSTNLGANAVSGSTYLWKPSTGLSSTSSSNPKASPGSTTSYTLVETDINGCIDSNTVKVTVNPIPNAKAGSPQTICAGQPVSIGAASVTGDTYAWSPVTGLSSTTSSNPIATPSSTTSYTLTETITATGCSNSNAVIITVNPIPAAKAGSDVTICVNTSTTIGANSVSGDTYLWSPSTGLSSATVSNPTASPTSTTSYTLVETNTVTGCKDSNVVKVTVNPLPTPSVTGLATVCAGDTVSYNTTNNSGNSYTWVVQGGTINSGSGTNSIKVIWGAGNAGRVRVLEKAGSTSCQDSSFKTILINPLPTANPGTAATICMRKSTQIGSSSATGYKYSWISNPSGFSATISNPVVSPVTSTSYHLTVTNSVTGCKKTDSVKISVNPLPTVFTAPADTFCNTSTTANLSGSPSGGIWRGKGVTKSGVFTPSTAGVGVDTLYYVYTSPTTGCTDSALHIVNVVNPANVIAGQNDTVCISISNYKLKNYSPSGGTWSGTGIISPDSFSVSHTGVGTFTITYSVGKNTCKVSASKIVKVNALPIVSAGNADSVCLNLVDFALTGFSPSGGIWTGNGITDKTKGIFNPHIAGVGSQTLTYTYTDPKTHCTNSDTKILKVLPLPVISIQNDSFQCKGVAAGFSATSTNTASYQWSFGDNSFGSGSSTTHVYNNTGTYTIRLIGATNDGCQDTLYSKIRISEPPVANFSRTPYSGPAPVTVSVSNLSTGEINSYEWNFGNKDSTTKQNPADEIYPQSDNGDTTYYITLTVKNKCGVSVHKDSVLVFPLPKARFGTDRDESCTPFTVHFSNKSVGKPTSYLWDFGNGKKSTLQDPPPQVYTTDSTVKTYIITLVAINKYGTDTFRHTITVLPNRVKAFFNANDTEGCVPFTVKFTDFSKGATFVSWSFGDGDSSAQQNPIYTFTKAGTYTVHEFANDGCSFDTAKVQIIVHPKPPVSWKAIPTCANDSMQFTNTSSNFSGCRWYFGDGDTSRVVSPKHAYLKPGKYYVTLTIQSLTYGCPSSFSDSVEVDSVPKASFTAMPQTGCHPLDVKFTNTGTKNIFYSWDFGDGNSTNAENPDHLYLDSGIYLVKLSIITPLGCTNKVQKPITVFPYPHAKFSISPDPVCGAPHVVKFHNQSIGAVGYAWSFGNGAKSNNDSPSVSFDTTGNYLAKLVVINTYGCKDSINHLFTIYHQPVASFIPQGEGCQASAISFKNTSTYMDRFLWNFGDSYSDSIHSDPSHIYSKPGSYSVNLVIIGAGGCEAAITRINAVQIDPKPVAAFSYLTEDNPTTGWVDFKADTIGIINYSWNFGDKDSSEGIEANPRHRYDEPGTYTVRLIVTNKFGCTDTVYHSITINYFDGLFVPNALAPQSGPPEEHVFLPKGASIQSYRLQIYTTWGELLWENEDLINGHPATGWDGTSNGKPMPEGVYVWKIAATFLNGHVWEGKSYNGEVKPMGTVTLVR